LDCGFSSLWVPAWMIRGSKPWGNIS
jgi:hypothetical protein